MYFSDSSNMDTTSQKLISVFSAANNLIDSEKFNTERTRLQNKDVMSILREELVRIRFDVSRTGRKYSIDNVFSANYNYVVSAYNKEEKYVLQVEAGRGIMNNEYVKDYLEACLMTNVDYLCIAVKNIYLSNNDFTTACDFLEWFIIVTESIFR